MRKFKLVIFFCTIFLNSYAQTNNAIEVKLKLLHEDDKNNQREFALGISVVNLTKEDIYLPNFFIFASIGGVHYYQKEKDEWKEIDISRHDYWKESEKSAKTTHGDVTIHVNQSTIRYSDNNLVTKKYSELVFNNFRYQDSLLRTYYNSAPDHHKLSIIDVESRPFLFLKAGQTLENLAVWSLDYLKTKKFVYKIAFNSEKRDTLRYYQAIKHYNGFEKKFEDLKYPDKIYGYKLFYPQTIISNVIMFDNSK